MQIAFMTANYVARQIGYHMDKGWGQGDKATNEHFKPIKTFGPRFEAYLADIAAMGFEAVDIWTSIINPQWLTDDHLDTAVDLLKQYNLSVATIGGWFGSNEEELEMSCQLATALGVTVLAGSTSMMTKDRPLLIEMLSKYGLKLGFENHPDEKTPQDVFKKIGDDADVIGATVDTGWFGTNGYNAADAIEQLQDRLLHVHLKDVLKVGTHETCRYGAGVVPIRECVETLKRIGYTGAISVEHEPDLFDPTEDIKASFQMLKEWLA